MSHVETLEPKHHVFRILFGQRPLTKFKDYRKNIKVDLVKHDDREQMLKATYGFARASWSEDGLDAERATREQMLDAIQQMLAGKALGLGLETMNFMFRISGITRIDTHQIVRQRIGVTFSQQCTGDRFINHSDVLVEESIVPHEKFLDNFIKATIASKMSYAEMNDSLDVSIQAARGILPHNFETFIYMNLNLMTFLFFHQKRIEDGSQTWQINEIAQQMADRICDVFPELKDVFEKNKTKFKFQKEASADRKNSFSTSLYLPKVDEFDYNNRDYLYPYTKSEMHFTNTPIEDRYFWGWDEVSKDEFEKIKTQYETMDTDVKKNHYTNEEILKLGQEITKTLEHEILKKPAN